MNTQDWIDKAKQLGPELGEYAARHDEDGTFVNESFMALKEDGMFKALVPTEHGGGGAGMRDICEFIREIGKHCGSTALSGSMRRWSSAMLSGRAPTTENC